MGKGGFGEVFTLTSRETGLGYAAKVLAFNSMIAHGRRLRIKREIEVMKALDHVGFLIFLRIVRAESSNTSAT